LDNFNRANGSIGSNWSGNPDEYSISSNQLSVDGNGAATDIYWGNEMFGADQEAYVTFTHIDPNADEQDLLLKSQSNSTWGEGVLEVLYDPAGQRVQVWTYDWPAEWVQQGADIPVTFADGDTLGARALVEGTVEVYKNGTLLGTRDITSWSYYADGGYIGLWFMGAQEAVLDDFGGGNAPTGAAPFPNTGLSDNFNRADGAIGSNWSGYTSAFAIASNQLDLTLLDWDTHIFWKNDNLPLGANQEAYVTLAHLDIAEGVDHALLLKSQSNNTFGDGVVEVSYYADGPYVQVWTYDPIDSWERHGQEIHVFFQDGDQFGTRAFADGTLEVYKNGIRMARRWINSWPYYDDGGYIGLWLEEALGTRLDDFGGGTISGGEAMMGAPGNPAAGVEASNSIEVGVTANAFDVQASGISLFWQGIPLEASQQASLTFTNIPARLPGESLKPHSNGIWGKGVVQVLYDVAGGRIQVWVYRSGNGWVQYGKDVAAKFVPGDTFRVSTLADGTVEIYRNGKLLAKRDVIP
jgi:hypothetical protein